MNKNTNLINILRRGTVLAALGVFMAAAAVTWLASAPAHATPHSARAELPQAGQPAPRAVPVALQPAGGEARAHAGDSEVDAPARERKSLSGKLNLNTASADQLRMLPGIGKVKAQRIVNYRQKHGKFKRVRDLRRVKGFGYKTVKKLTPYLDVKGDNTLKAN